MLIQIWILNLLFIIAYSEQSSLSSTTKYASFASLFDRSSVKDCSARCERLYNRSLKRIGHSIDTVAQVLRSKASAQDASIICWKFLDYDDCERQCENSNQVETSTFSNDRLFIVRKCSKLVSRSPYLKDFKCLHRFHTFLEVRCSSYAKEATRYRYLSKLAKSANGTINIDASLMHASFSTKRPKQMRKNRQMSRETLIQETCRYLHYHSTCLANAVFSHCPNANDLFNRFTLLDYFLSFVVPQNDELFTDKLLNYCQMYDFQKIARDLFDSTKTTVKRHVGNDSNGNGNNNGNGIENDLTTQPGIHVTQPLTLPPSIVTRFKPDKTTKQKSLFASDEDLIDTPPNFYYSSAKYTKSYRDALEKLNFYKTTGTNYRDRVDEVDGFTLITHPIPLDFSFENDEDQRYYSKRTPAPVQLTTRPDSILTETQFPRRHGQKVDRKHEPGSSKEGDFDDEDENIESDNESDDYKPPLLWPQNKDDSEDDKEDYVGEDESNGDGPLFRNERPHVFRIRQYGLEDGNPIGENLNNANRDSGKPISVTIDHADEDKVVTRLPYDYSAYDEEDDELDDPNDITYPGRRQREHTTKISSDVPSFSDMIRTFVTTALHPTTPNPNINRHENNNNSLLWLMFAYATFFAVAFLILTSLIFAMIVIRKRRKHDYYKTFIVKKHQQF